MAMGLVMGDPHGVMLHLWVPTEVGLILNPLPRLATGAGLLGFTMVAGRLQPSGTLAKPKDICVAARVDEAALIIEALTFAAERAGVAPILRSERDQARAANARYR